MTHMRMHREKRSMRAHMHACIRTCICYSYIYSGNSGSKNPCMHTLVLARLNYNELNMGPRRQYCSRFPRINISRE